MGERLLLPACLPSSSAVSQGGREKAASVVPGTRTGQQLGPERAVSLSLLLAVSLGSHGAHAKQINQDMLPPFRHGELGKKKKKGEMKTPNLPKVP